MEGTVPRLPMLLDPGLYAHSNSSQEAKILKVLVITASCATVTNPSFPSCWIDVAEVQLAKSSAEGSVLLLVTLGTLWQRPCSSTRSPSMTVVVSALLDLVLAVLPVIALSTEPVCTLSEFQGCLQSLQSVTQSNLAFASTREELYAVCRLTDSVHCVDDHMTRCFSPTQRKVFNHVVAGAREVIKELCVSGPTQEVYLRHALCFTNISLAEDKCAPTYRHLVHASETVNDKQNVEEGLRKSCCAFGEFVHCKYVHVSQDCGPEAGEFLQQHMDRISGPLIHEHCTAYTYGSDACSLANSCAFCSANSCAFCRLLLLLSLVAIWLTIRPSTSTTSQPGLQEAFT